MTFSQFDISPNNQFSATAMVAHSSLTNPITYAGTNCLRVQNSADTNTFAYQAAIKSSVDSSKYFDIPSTRARLSMRALLRRTVGGGGLPCRGAIGLFCKEKDNDNGGLALRASSYNLYSVHLGDIAGGTPSGAPGTHGVYLGLRKTAGWTLPTNPTPAALDTLAVASPVDIWARVRLDVTPTGTTSDLLEVYVATGTSLLTWGAPLVSTTLTNSNPSRYVPWAASGEGSGRRIGFFLHGNDNADANAGNRSSTGAAGNVRGYIDEFQVIVT